MNWPASQSTHKLSGLWGCTATVVPLIVLPGRPFVYIDRDGRDPLRVHSLPARTWFVLAFAT
jgi:hypothetical protein